MFKVADRPMIDKKAEKEKKSERKLVKGKAKLCYNSQLYGVVN